MMLQCGAARQAACARSPYGLEALAAGAALMPKR